MSYTLLTGATGFLGRRIAERFPQGHSLLRCTGRSSTEDLPNYRSAELRNMRQVTPLFENVDTVIHAAGLAHQFGKGQDTRNSFVQNNVIATENVLNASAESGVKHVVLVSSVSVYGLARHSDERMTCRPEGPYAESKLAAEKVAVRIAKQAEIRLTILRMATIYGEGDPGNVHRLLHAIAGGRFVWIGSGRNQKSLIHVDDAATACVVVATASSANGRSMVQVYNVSANPCSMRDIVQSIQCSLGVKPTRLRLPAIVPLFGTWAASKLTFGRGAPARLNKTVQKWLRDDVYDGARFMNDYAFQPQVSLQEGISREAAWYQRRAA